MINIDPTKGPNVEELAVMLHRFHTGEADRTVWPSELPKEIVRAAEKLLECCTVEYRGLVTAASPPKET